MSLTGVNTCKHCNGKGACYRASTPRTFTRPFKIRYSCVSCLRVEGYIDSIDEHLVVNCNVCRGSGLLPGANTFFQEYIKPKSFATEKRFQLESGDLEENA